MLVWSITWADMETGAGKTGEMLPTALSTLGAHFAKSMFLGGFDQLMTLVRQTKKGSGGGAWREEVWKKAAEGLLRLWIGVPNSFSAFGELADIRRWLSGGEPRAGGHGVPYSSCSMAGITPDIRIFREDARNAMLLVARLPNDAESIKVPEFRDRWQAFLSAVNLYQFLGQSLRVCVTSESNIDLTFRTPEEIEDARKDQWQTIEDTVVGSDTIEFVRCLRSTGVPYPVCEYYPGEEADYFAELAWIEAKVAYLTKDQETFASAWTAIGWRVAKASELAGWGPNGATRAREFVTRYFS
jgi:hypothetical protein